MLKIRYTIIALGMLLSPAAPADVHVGVGIGYPNVSIGINLPAYPNLVALLALAPVVVRLTREQLRAALDVR